MFNEVSCFSATNGHRICKIQAKFKQTTPAAMRYDNIGNFKFNQSDYIL